MRHLILKTCVAGACALGFVALGGHANAASPLALDGNEPLIMLAMDDEDMAVEEDLRPDDVPAMEDEGEPMMEPKMEESEGGNMEDEMIDKIGPGAE